MKGMTERAYPPYTTYRPFFKVLLEERARGEAEAVNEPERESAARPTTSCPAKKDHLSLGYVEARDLGIEHKGREEGAANALPEAFFPITHHKFVLSA